MRARFFRLYGGNYSAGMSGASAQGLTEYIALVFLVACVVLLGIRLFGQSLYCQYLIATSNLDQGGLPPECSEAGGDSVREEDEMTTTAPPPPPPPPTTAATTSATTALTTTMTMTTTRTPSTTASSTTSSSSTTTTSSTTSRATTSSTSSRTTSLSTTSIVLGNCYINRSTPQHCSMINGRCETNGVTSWITCSPICPLQTSDDMYTFCSQFNAAECATVAPPCYSVRQSADYCRRTRPCDH